MSVEATRLAARLLRWSGAALAALGTAGIVTVRSLQPATGPDPLAMMGTGVVLAGLALLLTFAAAAGLALLVAGLALGSEERSAREAARRRLARARAAGDADEE